MAATTKTRNHVPVLLLKTKSQPEDTYEECFLRNGSTADSSDTAASEQSLTFEPHFVPVLEHARHTSTLVHLKNLLQTGELKQKYGGMVFTSQRAVEAWTEVVDDVEADDSAFQNRGSTSHGAAKDGSAHDPFAGLETLTPFPLYVVGPATERALQSLTERYDHAVTGANAKTIYAHLNTSIHGAHTGNGANLASYILGHYNQFHREHWFNYFEAPRLPFIPLLGMSSENYGRKRLDGNDPRLTKKPLLFLVGEQRRDIIPKTLQEHAEGADKIVVDEVEVYRTEIMPSFDSDLKNIIERLDQDQSDDVRAVVVFSPQGSDVMLRRIGYLDSNDRPAERAKRREWKQGKTGNESPRWLLVAIGPTTRDYLRDRLGVELDVCAQKPTPDSLREGIETFLKEMCS